MRTLRLLVVRALLALGWLSLLIAAALFGLEQTGLAQRFVQELLAARLGVLGNSLAIESIDVLWLEPGLELRGLSIADRRELLVVERLRVDFRPRLDGALTLRRIDLENGSILLGQALENGLRGLFELPPAESGSPTGGVTTLPEVQLRGLELRLESPTGEPFGLGTLDLSVEAGALASAAPRVRGRLSLERATTDARSSVVDLTGALDDEGLVDVRASASQLALADLARLELPLFEHLRTASLDGSVALDGRWRMDPAGARPSSGRVRLAARDAALRPIAGGPPARGIELDLDARFEPTAEQGLWSAPAWRGAARFRASWDELDLRGAARLGAAARAGAAIEAWVRVPDLALDPQLVAQFGAPKWLRNPYEGAKPDGRFDVGFGIRCRDDWDASQPIDPYLEFTASVSNATPIRTRWHGVPPVPGKPRVGFPLPVTVEQLEVVYARTRRLPRPESLGVEARGAHHAGPVSVSFATWSPPVDVAPFAAEPRNAEEQVRISSSAVAIDAELEAAMAALESSRALQGLFETYRPAGTASLELELSDRRHANEMAARVRVGLKDARARWKELPLDARDVEGDVRFDADGSGAQMVALELSGRLPSAEAFELRGRVREHRRRGAPPGPTALEHFQIDVAGLSLNGADREVIAARWPGIGEALERFGPAGHADVRFSRAAGARTGVVETILEVVPREDLALVPAEVGIATRDVVGRVLTVGREVRSGAPGEPPLASNWTTTAAPLTGAWPGGARVAMDARFPDDAPARVVVHGAGLRPDEPELRARLLGARDGALDEGLGGLRLSGALDFTSVLAPAGAASADEHRVRLRRNDLAGPAGLRLRELEGEIVVDADGPSSPGLSGRLGQTSFTLSEASLALGPDEQRLIATVAAEDVPLDREHLGLFVDDRTLEALITDFGWRGRIDVPGWRLDWRSSPEAGTRVSLRGPFTVTDVHLDIGVPLSIGSASGEIRELVIENGAVRALGELRDMYGELMGRELGPARVLASHYGTRVSLDIFEGTFVRGEIRGLDQELRGEEPHLRPAPAFSIELVPPYPFQLALELEDVDVTRFLQGLFASGLADQGRLSAELRLFGDVDDVLSIRGAGRGELSDARLWSIPVFRDLFSQLGIEDTAVFDQMRTRFSLESGVVQMRDIEVRSPLLRLAGHGTLDLDGTLNHDFEVRYSVVDKLGIFRQLVYAVQNALLSVSIRGDMSRPVVILRSALTALFRPVADEYRSLPLPGYSPLPARF